MKRLFCFISGCLALIFASAQKIELPRGKTISLSFAQPISHVDRGNPDILVQQLPHTPGILLVKTNNQELSPSNLTVITEEGNVYSFEICFKEDATRLIYAIAPTMNPSIKEVARLVRNSPHTTRRPKDHAWGMTVRLSGAFVKDQILYLQLQLSNNSPLDYPIDMTRLFIRDRRRSKRTTSQEKPLIPIESIGGNSTSIPAFGQETFVVAIEQLTIPDKQYLAWEILERNGGRHLLLKIRNRDLLKAKRL